MSRTDVPTSNRIKSPLKYYIEFGGAEGVWAYWDGEKNVRVDALDFVVMDVRSSIGGWSDANNCRINSNIVKSTGKNPLTVRAGKVVLAEGLYADIKNDVVAAGGKFVTNIFAMAKIDGDWTPVDIQLSGACLRDWTAFVEASGNIFKVYEGVISASRGEQQKKGSVKYYTPNFVLSEISEGVAATADEFCKEKLMPYLEQ
jgi:hypothetical protein